MSQYLDKQTVEMYRDTETFREPTFVFYREMAGGLSHEGWVNAATWCFDLYFMQERKLQDALRALIRRDGTINMSRAQKLFYWSGIRIDKECEGIVLVGEVVAHFLEQEKEANDLCLTAEEGQ